MSNKNGQKLTETFLGEARIFTARDFRLGSLLFDQLDGLGGTIVNQAYPAGSFVAFMAPATFLALASQGIVHDSRDFIMNGLRTYAGTDKFPLASPWLMVDFAQETARITGHDGRNRMRAIAALGVKDDIPVLINPAGHAPDKLNLDTLCAFFGRAISQNGKEVNGPLFSRAQLGNRLFTAAPV